jgi:hypothetical protein
VAVEVFQQWGDDDSQRNDCGLASQSPWCGADTFSRKDGRNESAGWRRSESAVAHGLLDMTEPDGDEKMQLSALSIFTYSKIGGSTSGYNAWVYAR